MHAVRRANAQHLGAGLPMPTPPADDACYLAFKVRDGRFNGIHVRLTYRPTG